MKEKKLLIFHPALAPYRIDQLNALSEMYELKVVFLLDNLSDNPFDQQALRSQLLFPYSFLLKGINWKGRMFRFGILHEIRNFHPDLILGYEYSLTTQYLLLLKTLKLIHAQIGSIIDDNLDICYRVQSKIRELARSYSVKKLNFFVLLSSEVAKFYQNTFRLSAEQTIVWPLLQSEQRLRKSEDILEEIARGYQKKYSLEGKKVLLFVGRLIQEKALVRFIETNQAKLHDADLIFVIIGDGVERKSIEDAVRMAHLEEHVLLPGRFEGANLYGWYLCASGFVLPSLFEPFGAVVNEALIFGVPALCSSHAGAASLIRPENGMIFDPLDEDETRKTFSNFVSGLAVQQENSMEKRPSMMPFELADFMDQWPTVGKN